MAEQLAALEVASVKEKPPPPPPQSSADGATRAFGAMALFTAAKAAYDKVDPLDAAAREALHQKYAAKAVTLARKQGGVYVKAAQQIASLQGGSGGGGVPPAYTTALAELTDRAAPQDLRLFEAMIAEELCVPGWTVDAPSGSGLAAVRCPAIAAASLSQVHRASAEDGRELALKLQFPWLAEQVPTDFAVFKMVAGQMQPGGFDVSWLVDDLQKHVLSELDFLTEARHAGEAAAALAPRGESVLVPAVRIATRRLLATEWVEGLLRVDDAAGLAAAGICRRAAGRLVADVLLGEMPLRHGLVHGDPHSGNVYLRRPAAASGIPEQLVLLDHGLYHHPPAQLRLAVCRLVLACARPWVSSERVRACAEPLANELWPLLPLLLSPAFALGTGLSLSDLGEAAVGRIPPSVG